MNNWYIQGGKECSDICTLYDIIDPFSRVYGTYKDKVFSILKKLIEYKFYPNYKLLDNAINTGNITALEILHRLGIIPENIIHTASLFTGRSVTRSVPWLKRNGYV